jgi:dimethylargininase
MHFTHALARQPADTCGSGLTTADLGAPEAEKTRVQFDSYVDALRALGLAVTVLPPAPEFPDSHFVEDTAVILPELAVITHPGAPSRQGEVASIAPALALHRPLARMSEAAHLDGGDVLMVGRRFFVGLSARTDAAGVREFTRFVEPHGYEVSAIEVRDGLHLKSLVNYLGRNTLLLNEESARHPAFAGFERVVVRKDEEYAANTLWINDTLIVPLGYPDTLARLERLGLPIVQLDTSEFRKMDGGLTCLSLRY